MAEPSQRPATKNACKTRGCNYSFWAPDNGRCVAPKHVKQLRNTGIINSTTRLHLVGSFYEIYITMHGSMNIKQICLKIVIVVVLVIVISKAPKCYAICRCALPQLYSAQFHCCYGPVCTSLIVWTICLYTELSVSTLNYLSLHWTICLYTELSVSTLNVANVLPSQSQFKILVSAKCFF